MKKSGYSTDTYMSAQRRCAENLPQNNSESYLEACLEVTNKLKDLGHETPEMDYIQDKAFRVLGGVK
jgi:hypothetical protein